MSRPRPALVACLFLATMAAALPTAALPDAAPPSAPAEPFEPGGRDWMLVSEARPANERIRVLAAGAAAGAPCPTCAEPAVYETFDDVPYQLLRYVGRHVELFVPESYLAHFTTDQILGLLDAGDRTYELMRQIVRREPGGEHRLPIAFVPETACGPNAIGCGFVGHKGVEIWDGTLEEGGFSESYLAQVGGISEESIPHLILMHEMAHNFDVYSSHLHYHADSAHFWTDLLIPSTYVQGLMESEVPVGDGILDDLQWFERERAWLDETMLPYLNEPGHSWQRCVVDDDCEDTSAKRARVSLAFAVLHQAGLEALPRTMEFLDDWKRANPQAPETAEAKEELWLEALAAGARADIGGCLAAYAWHQSPSLPARLAQHGPPAPFCHDGDGDGAIGLLGDCAGADAGVGPGRPESANGVDDDCNGLVDEVVLAPASVSSSWHDPTIIPRPPVALDVDVRKGANVVGFRPASNSRLLGRLCSPRNGFQGWLGYWKPGGDADWNFHFQSGCTMKPGHFTSDRTWSVILVPGDPGPGDARLEIGFTPPWPGPWGSVGVLPVPGGFQLDATIADGSAFRQPADRVLFQVSGYGEVGSVPLAGGATATLQWPADPAAGNHFVYAQPYAGEVPAGPPLRVVFDPSLLAPCVPGPETACLLGGRFEARGTMSDFESPPNTLPVRVMDFPGGRAESAQAAFFESFQPGNFEIGVKMVDGCGLPEGSPLHSYWLFVGGLTSADSLVRVEDTATGAVFQWHNPPGNLPTTFGETAVFDCGGTPVPGACLSGDETACLLGRFLVSGTMRDFESPPNTLPVRVMGFPGSRAESDQAAFFESFQPGNFEVGVKMIDACALPPGSPGRAYWLFAGGLTSARTDLTIRQVATGQVVEWVNPSGSLPTSTGDTAAFACP